MKITKILPRKLAVAFEQWEIPRLEAEYEYHRRRTEVFQYCLAEARAELERLRREGKQ